MPQQCILSGAESYKVAIAEGATLLNRSPRIGSEGDRPLIDLI